MRWISGMLGATLLGGAGWYLGDLVGLGTALILSCIGSGCGLYWARKFFDEWLG